MAQHAILGNFGGKRSGCFLAALSHFADSRVGGLRRGPRRSAELRGAPGSSRYFGSGPLSRFTLLDG
eukprot:12487882-Alexandrium_andersonii.AAC.1